MIGSIFSLFMFVVMCVIVFSCAAGTVMFIIDVIRFAPARHKIQVMSSKLQYMIDHAEDPVPDPDEDDTSKVILKKKVGDDNESS